MKNIMTIFTGVIGAGAAQLTDVIPTGTDLTEITKLITQVIILIATIWALFKKKKKENTLP